MNRVAVAQLAGVFGVRGAFKCRPTPAGEGTLRVGGSYALAQEGGGRRLDLIELQRHRKHTIARFAGIGDPETAAALVGHILYAERAEIELGPDEYLVDDLIGLQLADDAGRALGTVVAVEHFPAQDCLVVEPGGSRVPLAKAFLRSIDLGSRTIVMSLPEGMLEPAAAPEAGRRRPGARSGRSPDLGSPRKR